MAESGMNGGERGIYAALAAITKDIKAVRKTRKSDFGQNGGKGGGYKYRSIDDFYNAFHPLLARHGVFILPRVLDVRTEPVATRGGAALHLLVRVAYRFCCRDGSAVECEAMGEAQDSSDKALGKALSYAHKYCLSQMFCVPAGNLPDPDAVKEDVDWSRRAQGQPQWQGQAPRPGPAWQKMFGLLNQKHGGNGAAMLRDAEDFLGRPVLSLRDISEAEAAGFYSALAELRAGRDTGGPEAARGPGY